ncbi:hypothetical protein [Cryobacterium sp. Y57]|uniref:hypothetical protein n=1 Tax=Cryobacterium sp. Y57 TaxID=2048287 RepID=UPI000CE2D785|nr:hypothetical protein [Cryobacterium sp. Y57]
MRQVLRSARSVLAERRARAASDTGYLIYVSVLVVGLVAVPATLAIVRGLAQPPVVAALSSPGSARIVGMIAAALAAGALLLGHTRGPVVPSPFLTEFLAGSDLPRHATVLRPFLVSGAVLACSVGAAVGLVVAARLVNGAAASVSAVLVVLGCLGFSGLLTVFWLMGQSLPRRITVGLALVVVAMGAATNGDTLRFTPWGWVALLWQGVSTGAPSVWWPAIALGVSSLALIGVPALLGNLRADEMMAQSRRWQSISTLVHIGDVAGASGTLRDPPTRGRRRRIPLTGPLMLAIVQRDVIAAGRFPVRITLGSLALVGAGWLTAVTAAMPDGADWITALAGVSLAYLGVGVWCDGLRNAADNATPGSLYGGSPLTLLGAHSVIPLLAAVVFGSLGAVGGAVGGAVAWWMLLAVFIVLVRVLDCAKGPMPIGLLLPVPTPVGDVSILNAMAWQADALLIVLVVAGGLTVHVGAAGTGGAGLGAALWLAVAGTLVAALALRRVRALRR